MLHAKTKKFGALVVVGLAATIALAGCTSGKSSTKASSTSGYLPTTSKSYTTPGPDDVLGTQAEGIPSTIPEPIHVNTMPPITASQMVVSEPFGAWQDALMVVDPATGKTVSVIDTAQVNFWLMPLPIVGSHAGLPYILAAEDWRARGFRGKADHIISYYGADPGAPAELVLPSDTRLHATDQAEALTSDGQYVVAWDDAVYGIRVFDVKAKKVTGSLRLVGCGPAVWLIGHSMYTFCTDDRSVVKVDIDDKGVPHQAASKQVFPTGFLGTRGSTFSASSKVALWISPENEVFRLDLSKGMPTADVPPVGTLALADGESAGVPVLSGDGTKFAVPITMGRGFGAPALRVVVYDSATLKPTYTYQAADIGSETGLSYNSDSSILYVLATKPGSFGNDNVLTGFNTTTGAQTSQVTLTKSANATGDLASLWAPQAINGN